MSKHQRIVMAQKQAALNSARTLLAEVEQLTSAVKRSIESGGFPVYLPDLVEKTATLQSLACIFHALADVDNKAKQERCHHEQRPE